MKWLHRRGVSVLLILAALLLWTIFSRSKTEQIKNTSKSTTIKSPKIIDSKEFTQNITEGICFDYAPDGLPEKPPESILIERDIYCLSANPTTKFADWVAYRLDTEIVDLDCPIEQTRDWELDPDLDPDVTLEPDNYRGAHRQLKTDRVHLAPLRSFCGADWQQVNYLSNIVPQSSKLNRGV